MSRKIFGTDGVRGKANIYPMTSEVALGLGRGIAQLFRKKGSPHKSRVVIGKDTRRSGYMFENALSSGVCSAGAEAILLGPMPTPAIAFITRAMRADAGVVISASHNAFGDNGIKFFDNEGFKLPDELELHLESTLEEKSFEDLPTDREVGKAFRVEDAPGRYIEFLKSTFPKNISLKGLKIVVDCANGAAYKVAPIVFEELGAEVFPLSISPNGFNINENCGALHPEGMAQKVKEVGAHLGVALDGDADRVILCDEQGEILDGDIFLAIAALELQKKSALAQNTVVATVMSNFALERFLKEKGIQLLRAQVGDRYVVEAMREKKLNLGGEQSGHIVFLDHATTGDGLLAALQILAVMVEQQKKLSELSKLFDPLPQVLENVKVQRREDFSKHPSLIKAIEAAEKKLHSSGRVLLRYSGTEALVRIMVESEKANAIEGIISDLKKEVLKVLA